MIYLDNGATTFVNEEVLEEYVRATREYRSNAGSVTSDGAKAAIALRQARESIASNLGVKPDEVIFTASASESNNAIIKGVARHYKHQGKTLITTPVEHNSVLTPMEQLKEEGFNVQIVDVDKYGRIDLEHLKELLTTYDDVILVSFISVNSVLGTIQDFDKLLNLIKTHSNAFIHLDHVQGFGKVAFDLNRVDFASLSLHKIHGIKGMGIIYKKEGHDFQPLIAGGAQEYCRRGGTVNIPGAVCSAKAIELIHNQYENELEEAKKRTEYLYEEFEKMPEIKLISKKEYSSPFTISISAPGYNSLLLVKAFEAYDVYISSMSACVANGTKNYIYEAIGRSDEEAAGSLRVCMTYETTQEELEIFIKALKEILEKLK